MQGWVKQGWKPGQELLCHPGGSGEPLRILEQDNYRPNAQKGWGVRYWRQGDQPEIQVLGGRWCKKEDHKRLGCQKPSAL